MSDAAILLERSPYEVDGEHLIGRDPGLLLRSRYHRLSVVQRFNVLCDRSQIRI